MIITSPLVLICVCNSEAGRESDDAYIITTYIKYRTYTKLIVHEIRNFSLSMVHCALQTSESSVQSSHDEGCSAVPPGLHQHLLKQPGALLSLLEH